MFDTVLHVDGYTSYRYDRPTKRGGGILAYVRDTISAAVVDISSNSVSHTEVGVFVASRGPLMNSDHCCVSVSHSHKKRATVTTNTLYNFFPDYTPSN